MVSVAPAATVKTPAHKPFVFVATVTEVFNSFSCTLMMSPSQPPLSPKNEPPPALLKLNVPEPFVTIA